MFLHGEWREEKNQTQRPKGSVSSDVTLPAKEYWPPGPSLLYDPVFEVVDRIPIISSSFICLTITLRVPRRPITTTLLGLRLARKFPLATASIED